MGKGLTDADYPERVPILEASDMCKHAFNNGSRHDLSGWRWKVFKDAAASEHVRQLIVEEITKRTGANGITRFCDHATLIEAADVWNTVMKGLGYVVKCYREAA